MRSEVPTVRWLTGKRPRQWLVCCLERAHALPLFVSGRTFLNDVFMLAFHDQRTFLVMYCRLHGEDASGFLRYEIDHFQIRVDGVADVDRAKKTTGCFRKRDEAIVDDVRKHTGAGGSLYEDLQTVGEQALVAAPPTIFDIVVDRMIVTRSQLKGCK